jgi:hypothetical protein
LALGPSELANVCQSRVCGRAQEEIKNSGNGNGQECPFHTCVALLR